MLEPGESEIVDVDSDNQEPATPTLVPGQNPDMPQKLTIKFKKFMNDFWDQYDADKNGVLSKEEFKVFLMDTFADDTQKDGDNNYSQNIIEQRYDKLFQDFDKDGNGEISKEEMFDFLLDMFGVESNQIDVEQVMDYSIKEKGPIGDNPKAAAKN